MKKVYIGLIIVAIIMLCTPVITYNSLVGLRAQVETKLSDVDTQLQRRADLIPNLVEVVKGYARQENEVFERVGEARDQLLDADTVEAKSVANEALSDEISQVITVAKDYPDLTGSAVYVGLMDELAGAENRIAYARSEYNETAGDYNAKIRSFPAVICAKLFGFKDAEIFKASADAQNVPKVGLS